MQQLTRFVKGNKKITKISEILYVLCLKNACAILWISCRQRKPTYAAILPRQPLGSGPVVVGLSGFHCISYFLDMFKKSDSIKWILVIWWILVIGDLVNTVFKKIIMQSIFFKFISNICKPRHKLNRLSIKHQLTQISRTFCKRRP